MLAFLRRSVTFCVLLPITCLASSPDLKPEELIQRHLDSIGTVQARSAKSRVVEGVADYRLLVGGSGEIRGKAVLASEGQKLRVLLKVNALQYRGEQFIFDGRKIDIAGTYNDKSRSDLGDFLLGQDAMLRSGLIGGVLSTAWPLLDADSWKNRVHFQGMKKMEGHGLYALSYKPKGHSDLEITLYFEPKTFHHVLTIYQASFAAGLAAPAGPSQGASDRRQRRPERNPLSHRGAL